MATYDDKNEKTLGTQGEEDSLKGKANQAAGTVQKNVGKALGNHEMEAKGAAREVGGKLQDKGGQAEKKVDHALRSDDNV